MYPYLAALMEKNDISFNSAAEVLGVSESDFRNLLFHSSFSVEDAFLLKNRFFPQEDVAVLFKRSVLTRAVT